MGSFFCFASVAWQEKLLQQRLDSYSWIAACCHREARILARRKRIQDRVATIQLGEATGGKEGEKREEVGKGRQQIIESKRRLFRVKLRTDQEVTSIRVAGDDRELQHRVQEELTRQVGEGG